jgi:acyl-CoA synthetase (AMP-forming)/AMP-acid ligase II
MAERAVLAFGNEQYAMPRLEAFTDGFATALELRGVRPGHRVALMSSNRPEFAMALRAILRLGAAAVLMSPAWKRAEAEHALDLTKPAHAVGDHPVLAELRPMLHLDDPITPGQRTFELPDPESESLLVFSSGTTGMPKAVRHSHNSLAAAKRHWRDALQLVSTDRLQVATPPATSSDCSTSSPRWTQVPGSGGIKGSTSRRCCATSRTSAQSVMGGTSQIQKKHHRVTHAGIRSLTCTTCPKKSTSGPTAACASSP